MTNLPFLLQTTNFLSQSICTNIPPHQSPGARTNFHYLCNTDYKMKQKLTTANLGRPRQHRREGGKGKGGMGADAMGTLRRNGRPVGAESFTRHHMWNRGAGKLEEGGRAMERAKKNRLEMTKNQLKSQRGMFRIGRESGTVEKCLKCKKSAQNCSVEREKARRSTGTAQIKSEWPRLNPGGFGDVKIGEIFSLQLIVLIIKEDRGGNPWRYLKMDRNSTRMWCAHKHMHIQPTRILHICRQLPDISKICGHACKTCAELTKC